MDTWTSNEWLELADVSFTILSIVVSTFVAYWIVVSIQKRLSNEQSFRTYLTHSVQQVKTNYDNLLQQLINGKTHAQDLKRELGTNEKQIHELMRLINTKYSQIDNKYFDAWIVKMRNDVDGLQEYEDSFRTNKLVKLSPEHQKIIAHHKSDLEGKINEFIILLFKQ